MASWSSYWNRALSIQRCYLHIWYIHDDVIKWKHFPRNWPLVRGIHRSPVSSPHKGQWRGALKFSLICVWINGWINNREVGDLRRYRAHYDVTVMFFIWFDPCIKSVWCYSSAFLSLLDWKRTHGLCGLDVILAGKFEIRRSLSKWWVYGRPALMRSFE